MTARRKVKLGSYFLQKFANAIHREKEDFKYFFYKERKREQRLIDQIKKTGVIHLAY